MLMNTIPLLPSRDNLPEQAFSLASIYLTHHLLFVYRVNDMRNAQAAWKKYLLYYWVHHKKKAPLSWPIKERNLWRWQCGTSEADRRKANNLPVWLARYMPDSDNGFRQSEQSWCGMDLVWNPAYMSYLDPWAALEQAALNCIDLERQIQFDTETNTHA